MKKPITYFLFLLCFAASCSDQRFDPEPGQTPTGSLTLTIKGAGPATQATESGQPNECNASRIELFYFDAAGTCLAAQEIRPEAGATAIDFPCNVHIPNDDFFVHSEDITLIGVASATTGLIGKPLGEITEEGVKAYVHTGLNSDSETFYPDGTTRFIPMIAEGTVNFSKNSPNILSMTRAVAKIRLKVDGSTWASNSNITPDIAGLDVHLIDAPSQQMIFHAASEGVGTYNLLTTPWIVQGGGVLHPETASDVTYDHLVYVYKTSKTHPSQTAPLSMEIKLPYTVNASGQKVDGNYYKFSLLDNIAGNEIVGNMIYNIILKVNGFGDEQNVITTLVSVEPWGVENTNVNLQ